MTDDLPPNFGHQPLITSSPTVAFGYVWRCTDTHSRTPCPVWCWDTFMSKKQALAHYYSTHRVAHLIKRMTPHTVKVEKDPMTGRYDWRCSCGTRPRQDYAQRRRALAVATMHANTALIEWAKMAVASEENDFRSMHAQELERQRQIRVKQARMDRMTPEERQREIQRNLDFLL